MQKREFIKEQALLALRKYTLKKELTEDTLVRELKLKGMNAVYARDALEEITGTKPSDDEFENINTVGQIIDLFYKHSPLPDNFDYESEMERTKKILDNIMPESTVQGIVAVVGLIVVAYILGTNEILCHWFHSHFNF